jgi:hypothetical protein
MRYRLTNNTARQAKGGRNIFTSLVGKLLKPGDTVLVNRLDGGTRRLVEVGDLKCEEGNFEPGPVVSEKEPEALKPPSSVSHPAPSEPGALARKAEVPKAPPSTPPPASVVHEGEPPPGSLGKKRPEAPKPEPVSYTGRPPVGQRPVDLVEPEPKPAQPELKLEPELKPVVVTADDPKKSSHKSSTHRVIGRKPRNAD